MNKKYVLLFLLISLVVGVISYVVLENIFIALGVFVVYLVFSFTLIYSTLKKHDQFIKKYKDCLKFENNFIFALSIKRSIELALDSAVNSMSEDFIEQYNSLGKITCEEKLDYMSNYFCSADFQMFLYVIKSWNERGGNIIEMSKYLTSNLRNVEESILKYENLAKKKYYEIAILWTLVFLIPVLLKYCLKDFYSQIKGEIIFIISFSLLCMFALFSIILMIYKCTKTNYGRYQKDEKIV